MCIRDRIKTATTPPQAAAKIVEVIKSKNPKLHNQLELKSKMFMALNRILPRPIRDWMLLRQMDIRV